MSTREIDPRRTNPNAFGVRSVLRAVTYLGPGKCASGPIQHARRLYRKAAMAVPTANSTPSRTSALRTFCTEGRAHYHNVRRRSIRRRTLRRNRGGEGTGTTSGTKEVGTSPFCPPRARRRSHRPGVLEGTLELMHRHRGVIAHARRVRKVSVARQQHIFQFGARRFS
jgi:hypothetical protein